jgi:hypothetical protein
MKSVRELEISQTEFIYMSYSTLSQDFQFSSFFHLTEYIDIYCGNLDVQITVKSSTQKDSLKFISLLLRTPNYREEILKSICLFVILTPPDASGVKLCRVQDKVIEYDYNQKCKTQRLHTTGKETRKK